MAIVRSKAKSLCTAAELALVDASSPKSIGQLSNSQLRQKVVRARKLLDKWRGQAEGQRRVAKAKLGARPASAAERSAEKAELFAEVLKRFELQLAKTDDQSSPVVGKRKESPRKTRNRQHRATRASVRDDLAESRLELSTKKKVTRRKVTPIAVEASASSTSPKHGETSAPAKPLTKRPRKLSIPVASSKKTTPGTTEPQSVVATGKQARATTRVKQNRLQAAGVKRIQKHTSAQNKRNQAKRDSR